MHLVFAYLENLCNMYLCVDFVWSQCKTMYLWGPHISSPRIFRSSNTHCIAVKINEHVPCFICSTSSQYKTTACADGIFHYFLFLLGWIIEKHLKVSSWLLFSFGIFHSFLANLCRTRVYSECCSAHKLV